MNKILIIISVIITLHLASCGTQIYEVNQKVAAPIYNSDLVPLNAVNTWRLVNVRVEPKDMFVNMVNNSAPTLSIAKDGSFSGYDGCNGYGGDIKWIDDDQIVFSKHLSTSRGCPPDVYWHNTFHQALRRVNNYIVQNGKLLLKMDSHILMTFSRN